MSSVSDSDVTGTPADASVAEVGETSTLADASVAEVGETSTPADASVAEVGETSTPADASVAEVDSKDTPATKMRPPDSGDSATIKIPPATGGKDAETEKILEQARRKKAFDDEWMNKLAGWATPASDVDAAVNSAVERFLSATSQPNYQVTETGRQQGMTVWRITTIDERSRTPSHFCQAHVPLRRMRQKMHEEATWVDSGVLTTALLSLMIAPGKTTFRGALVEEIRLTGYIDSGKVTILQDEKGGMRSLRRMKLRTRLCFRLAGTDAGWWCVTLGTSPQITLQPGEPSEQSNLPVDIALFQSYENSGNVEEWESVARAVLGIGKKKTRKRKKKKKKKKKKKHMDDASDKSKDTLPDPSADDA